MESRAAFTEYKGKAKGAGMSGHQSNAMITDEWLTPPAIIKSLGRFDLDPCSPINRPWDTADHHFNINDDGLNKDWWGRVWMNPVYGRACIDWMKKLVKHGNGISIIFARTETKMFFETVWGKADSVFFFDGRLYFHTVDGMRAKANAGAPNCLVSYGESNAQAIEDSGLKGKHVALNSAPIVVVGISPSWQSVVRIVLSRSNGEAAMKAIYDMVEMLAPDKVQSNFHYKEKIRQTLQRHFSSKGEGVWQLPAA